MHRHTAAAIALGLPAFVVGFGLLAASADAGGDPFVDYRTLSVAGRFLFGVSGWLWLVAILGLLTRPRADRSTARSVGTSGRVADWAAAAVLPIYVLHQPVLVAIAFYVVRRDLHPVAKYLVIALVTLLAVVAVYDLLIRRTRPTRFVFGMRPGGGAALSAGRGGPVRADPIGP